MRVIDDVPKKLEEWTYEAVVHLVKKYLDEPGIYDFKEVLNPTNPREGRITLHQSDGQCVPWQIAVRYSCVSRE